MQNSALVITANFQPLRFVLRGKDDLWNPTLEQINAREYDYVKLHRISTYFDVDIAPFSIGICFDGTLVLPAIAQYRDRLRVLSEFNKFLADLLFGGVYCEAATPSDIGYGSISEHAYVNIGGGARGASAAFHIAARTKIIGAMDVIKLLSPEVIFIDDLQAAFESGRRMIAKIGNIPREQMLYGTSFYIRNQWSECLIHIWTVIERLVELTWQKYVIHASMLSSKRRKDFLEDNKTWPVSAKLEVLFQKNLLPAAVYEIIDDARKARNKFAHEGIVPSQEIALKAIEACIRLSSLCASNFLQTDLFENLLSMVAKRCKTDLVPKHDKILPSHWIDLPPLPGDKEWGDRPYEIIPELQLKPVKKDSVSDKKKNV